MTDVDHGLPMGEMLLKGMSTRFVQILVGVHIYYSSHIYGPHEVIIGAAALASAYDSAYVCKSF